MASYGASVGQGSPCEPPISGHIALLFYLVRILLRTGRRKRKEGRGKERQNVANWTRLPRLTRFFFSKADRPTFPRLCESRTARNEVGWRRRKEGIELQLLSDFSHPNEDASHHHLDLFDRAVDSVKVFSSSSTKVKACQGSTVGNRNDEYR